MNLHGGASVAGFSLWSLLGMCTFVRAYVCVASERPSYPSCPPLRWLLNQMVTSFLAVPGHLAPQLTAVWEPEPCK